MSEQFQIFKCNICGNITEILHPGSSSIVCCGEQMQILEEQTADSSTEKHVPVIEKTSDGYKIIVGSTIHPMEEKHYIEWIEIIADGISYTKFLKPGDEPVAEFKTDAKSIIAREYCNVHSLWKNEA